LKCASLRSAQRSAVQILRLAGSKKISTLNSIPRHLEVSERNTARASLDEGENTREESREMATDIMATSTTELTHSVCVARFIHFALASLKIKMLHASLGAAKNWWEGGDFGRRR